MSQTQQQQLQEITIEDLELSLEVYEIESQEKLKKLQQIFVDKKYVDLSKMFYEDRSSLEIKFQNIVSDLTEFLIKQQIASTDKLRKTFHKILQNPLTFLFKVSRFEIFNLKLNAFDIELQPIEAIVQLGNSIQTNIDEYLLIAEKLESKYDGGEYKSFTQFTSQAKIRLIQDQIFIFYNYLRKGGNIIKKKFQDKIKVVQIYNKIQSKILQRSINSKDLKTLKELSILNYEIYLFQSTYDVLCFYLKLPLRSEFQEIFKELESIATKAKQTSNFDIFILIFLRYSKEIFAKLDQEGIDPAFSKYIENTLTSILQLWGCRLCHYQQFLQLFQKLINLHPIKANVLKLCGQHNPSLQKDDIVLLRTHFKHDLIQKHSELLSLFKSKTIEETNNYLNILYHKILYNIDFSSISREQLLDLLQLINGNTSLAEFFGIVEKALKEWNHSIDLVNSHKFIESEFKFPGLSRQKILQSIRLFNNTCILQSKGIKEYETTIKNNHLKRSFVCLCQFLLKNQQSIELIKTEELLSLFLINFLEFTKKTYSKNEEWQKICLTFTQKLHILKGSYAQKAIKSIRSILIQYPEYFTVKSMTNILQNLLQGENFFKLQQQGESISLINNIMMNQTNKNNDQLKKFKYFHAFAHNTISVTPQEQSFLKKYAIINSNVIQPKNYGCFTFSELEIVTNPIQFDKVMDNYYFTLDNNSKRYVQYLAADFFKLINQKQYQKAHLNLQIITNLIENYPICIPLLCSTRIRLQNNSSKRFGEILVNNISPLCLGVVKKIAQCRIIRYKNGKDFIKQQILPVFLKETIRLLNQGSQHSEHYVLLSICLTNYKLSQLKIDLIQKSIELIKYKLNTTDNQQTVYILSQVQFDILKVFFQKKQIDMRKNGLTALFHALAWNEVRTKNSGVQVSEGVKEYKKNVINDQIMITPFAISHDFNVQQSRLQKPGQIKIKNIQNHYKQILPSEILESNNKILTNTLQNNNSNHKIINLASLKYNLENRLGKQIHTACLSEGFKLFQNDKQITPDIQLNEQNNTLVQYYMKEFQLPEISSNMVIKYILAIIDKKIQYSPIFSNYINLQKLYFALILLLRFYIQKYIPRVKDESCVDKLLNVSEQERVKRSKDIMNILIKIGYTNLWSQNFNSLSKLSYFKELAQKSNYSNESQQQTFLSWILKLTLQKQQYKIQLNSLLQSIFKTRPQDQTNLMYKISIDKILLNSIMKSLEIENLSYISLLFHSNFNNLRLYTDQLHEGLKALNIASKNRAFNEYIQLSKDADDAQFFSPLKLFKYNFGFFIKIESEGYNFKKLQQQKLSRERVIKSLRTNANNQTLLKQIQKIIQQYQQQLQKLQLNIANRVKSFYLVTKLRDLSYQNSLTVCLLYQILKQKKIETSVILNKIKQIQIFSLVTQMYNDLVKFDWNDSDFVGKDRHLTQKQVNLCTTRRYSHSINKIYQKCQLQFDQIYQRCIDALKIFFVTPQGHQWISSLNIYPPFLVKSFVNSQIPHKFIEQQKTKINLTLQQVNQVVLMSQQASFSSLVKSLRQLNKNYFLIKDKIKIQFKNKTYRLNQFIQPLKQHLTNAETFNKSKDGLLLFNKYKTSEKTLEQIQILGLIIGYCIYHGIPIDLPLHSSIISALSFNICDSDDLIDIDFKVWQDLRNTMSSIDSKELNLTFSYVFQSLANLKPERIQLIDKGASKKVNNLNRQQYCDHVCCYLLYNTVGKQIRRLLQGVVYICPLGIISCMKIKQIHNILLSKNSNYSKLILQKHMKKRGLILPNSSIIKSNRIENSKDYQTVQWLLEIIEENSNIKEKIWPDECNLFLSTCLSQGIIVDLELKMVGIGRINSKGELKGGLQKLIF